MEDLSRIKGAVDPELMTNATMLVVGLGGVVSLCENLVKTNIGTLIAVDFDIVTKSNFITQGFEEADINTLKTEALGKKLKSINKTVNYKPINANFVSLSEESVEKLVKMVDILLFMTNDLPTQAFGNRIASKYQKPAIFAIVYEKAQAAEITFTIPGTNPGCYRCGVSPRYKVYGDGYANVVQQPQSSVFQTHYLNSCLRLLILAILHRNTKGFEFSNWFGDYWDRNLLKLRMKPDYRTLENSLYTKVFQRSPYVFNFDAVWQNIESECLPKFKPHSDCSTTNNNNLS